MPAEVQVEDISVGRCIRHVWQTQQPNSRSQYRSLALEHQGDLPGKLEDLHGLFPQIGLTGFNLNILKCIKDLYKIQGFFKYYG